MQTRWVLRFKRLASLGSVGSRQCILTVLNKVIILGTRTYLLFGGQMISVGGLLSACVLNTK